MNSIGYQLKHDPPYQLIPLIWVPPAITIISSLVIDHYLASKPMLSRTVMDVVNRVFFAHFGFYCLLLATLSTTGVFFQDSGEAVAVIMSFLLIKQFLNLSLMFLCNIGTQLLLVVDPTNLYSEAFEKKVKLLVVFVVPMCSALVSFTTGYYLDVKPQGYYFLHHKPNEDKVVITIQASIFLLIFCAFWTSRIWIQRVQGHERSNHILGSKAVALFCADVWIYCLTSIFLINYPTYRRYLHALGPNLVLCKFTATIVVFHNSVRNHVCHHWQPLRGLTRLWAIRLVRRVEIQDTNSVEMVPSRN